MDEAPLGGGTPEEFLEFVMDVERYAEVDDKIGAIDWVRKEDGFTEFKFRPRLPGMPRPAPKVVSQMRLSQGERIDIRLAPLPQNKFSHRVGAFEASFVCEPVEEGTRVTRTISIEVVPVVRRLIEPVMQRRLTRSVDEEIRLAKERLEGSA